MSKRKRPTTSDNDGHGVLTSHGWLMKAEPDSRIEKGVDISFSVDQFAAMPKQITQWDGVRNPEARTIMKDKMKVGDSVLFYHSNCKLPGIAGLAQVVKEGYPDYTAWDPKHPYFDSKTDKNHPKWFMVDVQLKRKLPHFVPLALLQVLAKGSSQQLGYLTAEHLAAIRSMTLLNRGRLSVQHVEPLALEAITLMGTTGGWQEWPGKWQAKPSVKVTSPDQTKRKIPTRKKPKT